MLRKNETIIGEQEADYLVQEYLKIDYEASSMQDFLSAIWRSIRNNIPLDKNTSVLDIGCGRGYFLKY
jgi:cyclopropane fatty-acyl-phospholipid synthase-like methyltransferase